MSSIDHIILEELRGVRSLLLNKQSDYCDTEQACAILGLNNYRYLKQLKDRDILKRYPRAKGWVYKKTDLDLIRKALDNETIILEPINNKK